MAARELLEEALVTARTGSPVQIAAVLLDPADAALAVGNATAASGLVSEADAAGRRSDDRLSQPRAVHALGRIARAIIRS